VGRPKALDLYSCEGGAARGYDLAGFDVYGVDLFTSTKGGFSRKRYPYPARQGDALFALEMLLADGRLRFDNGEGLGLSDFAAIHASPPCQHASAGTRAMRSRGDNRHPALIEPTRELLRRTGLPYVIENVKGAALIDPITLCGTMFGLTAVDEDGTPLEMWRHRLFESNVPLRTWECQHGAFSDQVAGSYGGARRDKKEARFVRHGGYVPSKAVQQELLGIDWMTERGMYQSLPPIYTQFIGRSLLDHLRKGVQL
jgi:DNA (cytosine-5)-methyltransferase 1